MCARIELSEVRRRPLIYYRMNERMGSKACKNYGTGGATYDGSFWGDIAFGTICGVLNDESRLCCQFNRGRPVRCSS